MPDGPLFDRDPSGGFYGRRRNGCGEVICFYKSVFQF